MKVIIGLPNCREITLITLMSFRWGPEMYLSVEDTQCVLHYYIQYYMIDFILQLTSWYFNKCSVTSPSMSYDIVFIYTDK